ncbi:hypothetical protein HBE96_23225 [Clostridium sp. P21]|uniref:Uncharacterized protein n=1 Tax=Clostridium muellerianum TaxID=2716538 RepID=A0A7Y0EL52_9CLOT|nr:hypothetical protein [Clostridium muellerianum]NMM65494.1 hypothetical protein [Clostridium muellerianum]
MNKRLTIFLLPLIAIWMFFLAKIGMNGFTVFLGIVFSIIYVCIAAGIVDGVTKAKGEMYLANKYDEEKNKSN